jgi:hypothetical protein
MSKAPVKRKRGALLPGAQEQAEQLAVVRKISKEEAVKEVKKLVQKLKSDRTRAESYAEKARYILIPMSHKEEVYEKGDEEGDEKGKGKGKGSKSKKNGAIPLLFVSAECGKIFTELKFGTAPVELNKETGLDVIFAIQAESAFTLGVRTEREMTVEEKEEEQWECPENPNSWYEPICASVENGPECHTIRFVNGFPICALEPGSGLTLLFDQPDQSSCTVFGLRWPGYVRDEIPECFVSVNQSMLQLSDGGMTLRGPSSAEPEPEPEPRSGSKLETLDEGDEESEDSSEGD